MPQTIFRVGERVVTRDGFYAKIVHMEGMPAQHSDTFDQILVLDVASVGQREGMHASLVIPSRSRTVPTVGKYTGRILAANQRLHTCQRALQRLRHKKKNLGFSLLYDCLVVRKTNRAAIRKMLDRSARRTIFQAFHGYARAVGSIVAQRMKVGRAIESWKAHRQLAGAFDCYAGAVDTLVAQREKVAKTMARWKAPGLKKAWERWEAYLEDVWQERAQEAQQLSKRELRNRRISQLSMKILSRWKCVGLTWAVNGWLALAIQQKGATIRVFLHVVCT